MKRVTKTSRLSSHGGLFELDVVSVHVGDDIVEVNYWYRVDGHPVVAGVWRDAFAMCADAKVTRLESGEPK